MRRRLTLALALLAGLSLTAFVAGLRLLLGGDSTPPELREGARAPRAAGQALRRSERAAARRQGRASKSGSPNSAIRSSPTSGPPGAGPAASSSRCSSKSRRNSARKSPSSASTPKTQKRSDRMARRNARSLTRATSNPRRELAVGAEAHRARPTPPSTTPRVNTSTPGSASTQAAELEADIKKYALGGA